MSTLYRLSIVYSDNSRTEGTYLTQSEAMEKAAHFALNLPIGARLELTVITFSEPVILWPKT